MKDNYYRWYAFSIGLFLMILAWFVKDHLVGGWLFILGSLIWFLCLGYGRRLFKH